MDNDKNKLIESVRTTIQKHQMIESSDSILVGASGGADSVALLRALSNLGYQLGVGHLNHGWRGSASDEDEDFVRKLAEELCIPFYVERVHPINVKRTEASARKERQFFLHRLMLQRGFTKIALAHTQNDRNETLLLNLFRGSGPEGLVSMKPVSGQLIRPLINCSRGEIESYLNQAGQGWREDESNNDYNFARNRVRHEILPKLASDFNPNISTTLARTVEIIEGENHWMDGVVNAWLKERYLDERNTTILKLDNLVDQPVGFIRRVLREALRRRSSHLNDIGFSHLESVRSLLKPGKSGKRVELPGDLLVERSFDTLVFGDAYKVGADYDYELRIPGRIVVPEIGYLIEAKVVIGGNSNPEPWRALVDGESLGPCVRIRNWRNGDTYSPVGLHASKLKKLFQNERISRRQRRQWPVLVAKSSIVWVASFPVSREFAPTGRSRSIIEIEASPLH